MGEDERETLRRQLQVFAVEAAAGVRKVGERADR